MSFALPGCRSNFSLLWGTAFPEQLAEAAERQGLHHIGLADGDNLYGAADFSTACRNFGVKPIIGVRLTTGLGELHLIAKNYAGYQNLCRLVTKRQLDGHPDNEIVAGLSENLICLATGNLPDLKNIFENNLYLSVDGREDDSTLNEANRLGIEPVANPSVSFLEPDDYQLHLLLRAIDSGSLLDNLSGTPRDAVDAFLPDETMMRRRFAHLPQAITTGLILAERCTVNFPEHKNILPDFSPPDDIRLGDKKTHLRQKALDGLRRKQGRIAASYLARLDFELEVISRTGFTDYFLIVSGIVDHCHSVDIPVVGRGSAAGSLVAYSLAITQVDPIKERLYFERFLNEARRDPPDIDLDIDWRRRDELLEYIYDSYGHDRTAMIATYTRFRSRLAVREVAKAMGLPPDELNNLSKRLPRGNPSEITKAAAKLPANSQAALTLKRYQPILDVAARLDNFPRHLGIHPGGIVITPQPMTDYVALERATKGLVVTQCDMYQAARLGLIKIDILGQRGQAVIVDCLNYARKIEGDDFKIPDGDPAAIKLLQSGQTIGNFQIESPGLRALLRDIKPVELNDITLALALIRPGASDSGMKKVFLDRHHGLEPDRFPHPRLEKILGETHGVFIYQEQVLLCAREIAGFNLPSADLLRRAMTKERRGDRYRQLYDRFLEGAADNDIPQKKAIEIFKLLSLFAGYGFCKAHAATYGYLAYQSAYLKAHYPQRFMTAVINNDGGYYPASVYFAEARRIGVAIAPPDINLSDALETLRDNKIYVGLNRVRNLTGETVRHIIAHQPFASFDDFLSKIRLSVGELENLVKVGAFDRIDQNRPRLLWRIRLMKNKSLRKPDLLRNEEDIFSGQLMAPTAKHLPDLPDVTPLERFLYEREILGFSASCHPLEVFPAYNRKPFSTLTTPEQMKKEKPTTAWLVDVKRIKTREKKQAMVFLTFEDLNDSFEVVLFPEAYKRQSEIIRHHRFLRIEGDLNIEGKNIAIIGQSLSPAPTGLPEKPYI